MLGPPSKLIP